MRIMSTKPIFLLLFLSLMFSGEVMAKRAIFNFSHPRHQVMFGFQQSATINNPDGGEMTTSSSYGLSEEYEVEGDIYILSRNLIDIEYSLSLELNQEFNADQESKNLELGYDVSSSLLRRKRFPMNLNAFSRNKRISRSGSQTYTVSSQGYGAKLRLVSDLVPTLISYNSTTSTTDGLSVDRELTRNFFLLSSRHKYEEISNTTFDYSFSTVDNSLAETTAGNQHTESWSAGVSNLINFSINDREGRLTSFLREGRTASSEKSKTTDWGERFYLELGKALTWRVEYDNKFRNESSQIARNQSYRSSLEHKLFKSLTTSLSGALSDTDTLNGQVNGTSINFAQSYTKKLPAEKHLQLSWQYSRSKTDRNLNNNQVPVVDEQLVVAPTGNLLANIDIDPGSIVVYNFDRTITYLPSEYIIQAVGRRVELVIPFGSAISNGDTISVDYDYTEVNKKIEFVDQLYGLSGKLTLLEKSLVLSGHLEVSTEDQVGSIKNDDVVLTDTLLYGFGAEFNKNRHNFLANYFKFSSSLNRYFQVDLKWFYKTALLGGRVSFRGQERYVGYSISGGESSDHYENSIIVGAALRKVWSPSLRSNFMADVVSVNSPTQNRQSLEFEADFKKFIGRTTISLTGDISYTREQDYGWTLQESLMLNLVRRL